MTHSDLHYVRMKNHTKSHSYIQSTLLSPHKSGTVPNPRGPEINIKFKPCPQGTHSLVGQIQECYYNTRKCILEYRDIWGAIKKKKWAKCGGTYLLISTPKTQRQADLCELEPSLDQAIHKQKELPWEWLVKISTEARGMELRTTT